MPVDFVRQISKTGIRFPPSPLCMYKPNRGLDPLQKDLLEAAQALLVGALGFLVALGLIYCHSP